MKLADILCEVAVVGGYWKMEESGDVRQWTPVLSNPPEDALFPFSVDSNRPRVASMVKAYQGFNILPNRKRKELSREEKKLFNGLEDALKQRSHTDVIDPADFARLSNDAVLNVSTKSGITKQAPQRIFITTPPSSSKVAEGFADAIQHHLGVPSNQVFHGHFAKRDVVDIIDEIEISTTISKANKDGMLERLYGWYANRSDTSIKIKDLRNGHRNALRKAGIDLFDVVKSIDIPHSTIPYLLIVDDNVQSGVSAQNIAKLFIKETGADVVNILSLAMFKYP